MTIEIGTLILLGSVVVFLVILGIIMTAVLTSNNYSVLKDTEKDVILLSDEMIDKVKDNFNDKILEYKEDIQLLDPNIIDKKYNIKIDEKQIQERLDEVVLKLQYYIDKALKDSVRDIKIPELKPITVTAPELPEQEVKITKYSSKTLYDIIENKYLDLLDKEADSIIINNNILKYIGNITIIINCASTATEFWYIEIQKDKNVRYGLSIEQKKRLSKIMNYVYFRNNRKFSASTSDFNYIKGKINEK